MTTTRRLRPIYFYLIWTLGVLACICFWLLLGWLIWKGVR